MDVDLWIETLREKHEVLAERDFRRLCERAKEVLIEQSNVAPVSPPITVCGDIHGQFFDLLELFRVSGEIPEVRYIFMGDYVDRGHHSIETISLLLAYKVKYPDCITLLRGNHESRQISFAYGFYDEVMRKYGNVNPWKYVMEVFDLFCIGAHINGEVLCIHGGLSPELNLIDQIRLLDRQQELPSVGPFADLMWSDPENLTTAWAKSPRGAGWLFGERAAKEFLQLNDLKLICRAHQLAQEGFQTWFGGSLLTIWSAPNYSYRCNNEACVAKFSESMERRLVHFEKSSHEKRFNETRHIVPYFL